MSQEKKEADARKRMTAAGFPPELVADPGMVLLIMRLLQDTVPQPPKWFEGTGSTYSGEIGDYGPVDTEMATVVWDDRKFAECYDDEDAKWLAASLKALYART